jgi:hypothetical protein
MMDRYRILNSYIRKCLKRSVQTFCMRNLCFEFTSIYIILQAYLFSLFYCNKQLSNAFTCYKIALKKLY